MRRKTDKCGKKCGILKSNKNQEPTNPVNTGVCGPYHWWRRGESNPLPFHSDTERVYFTAEGYAEYGEPCISVEIGQCQKIKKSAVKSAGQDS